MQEGLFWESIVTICEFHKLNCVWGGEGVIGVCVWFGAPTMHMSYGLNLAWHWHVVCVYVHLRSLSKIVCSSGVLVR